jgi:multicomponent Na+:H+ antiporter subunit G
MSVIIFISLLLFILGAFLMFLAGLGLLRLPDVFLRMSAATKASTLGAGFILIAAALFFEDLGTASRAIATVFFLLLTGPVAAHRIARAAYIDGVHLSDGTVRDDLQNHYDQKTHELESDPCDDFPVEDCEEGVRDVSPA